MNTENSFVVNMKESWEKDPKETQELLKKMELFYRKQAGELSYNEEGEPNYTGDYPLTLRKEWGITANKCLEYFNNPAKFE